MYVSQLLSEYIKNKKTNIKKCAEYFQMDRSTLYKIIRGERKAPSRDFILKISQYLYLTNDEKKELLNAYEIDKRVPLLLSSTCQFLSKRSCFIR